MLQSAIKKEVLVAQGEPGNYTVVYKDPTVLGNIIFSSYASGVEFGASFSTDLPIGIYKLSTSLAFFYEHLRP